MGLNIDERYKKYHYEEILLILFICSSNLNQYSEEDLVDFSEDIEGRIEDLFEPEFLKSLDGFIETDESIIRDFNELKVRLINMYDSEWHEKLRDSAINKDLTTMAAHILNKLEVSYIEPKLFKEEYLNIP
ncbi:MAG TPA: hypothetical protein VHD83_17865 [Puia sp.]|nr:hypothetical protein [Puia sp.]